MIPKKHKEFIDKAINILKEDLRIVGIKAGGSYITEDMDEFSDVDLVIVVSPESYDVVMNERDMIAESLGELLSSFIGFHVGEPRLLICLYGPELLHVDLKFVSLEEVADRVEDAVILWERDNKISERLKDKEAIFPIPTMQHIEDRMWIWVHYGAAKIGRGEIFESIEFISFLRQTVIGPLLLRRKGLLPKGVRKLEVNVPESMEDLKDTIAGHSLESCINALYKIVEMYVELRESFITNDFVKRERAEKLCMEYLDKIKTLNSRK